MSVETYPVVCMICSLAEKDENRMKNVCTGLFIHEMNKMGIANEIHEFVMTGCRNMLI